MQIVVQIKYNQIFTPNEDVLVSYGFSHGVLLISLKSGYRFPSNFFNICLCLRLLCLLPRRQGILQVLPRDFTDETYGCVSENVVYPLNPMVLLIIIPFLNGYFIGNIPYFQTNPYQKNLVSSAENPRESGSRCLANRFNVIQSCPMHVMFMFKVLHPFLCADDRL